MASIKKQMTEESPKGDDCVLDKIAGCIINKERKPKGRDMIARKGRQRTVDLETIEGKGLAGEKGANRREELRGDKGGKDCRGVPFRRARTKGLRRERGTTLVYRGKRTAETPP